MESGKNKIRWIKWGLVGCFILAQVYLIFIHRHLTLDINAAPNTNPTPHIMGERVISQTFMAQRDYLSQIEVMLGTFDRENDKDVIFELGRPDEEVILQKVFNASEVKNNLYHSIKFAPQKNSRGKEYYFALHSPESTMDNSICAWMNTQDVYPEGEYFFNSRAPGGDLTFRVYSLQPVSEVLKQINQKYPGLWGNKYFLILTVLFFVAVQLVVLVKLLDILLKYLDEFRAKKEGGRV